MAYIDAVKERLQQELKTAGFITSGEMGATKIYENVFLGELDKLNKRLEALEGKQA